ncbi:secreted TNF-receptor-like protein [Vaccinia virus]|uniref:Secreted TNF-receptor-like protein n=1 Tax=Vaccinia virus TaxID=10245 RepID=H2DVA5_VACCV|nr:secreted TNF-receptor-like protein [Vaccinia virus]
MYYFLHYYIGYGRYTYSATNGSCDEGEYLDKRHNQCCNQCPPGEFAKVRCSGSDNTKCERCPPHTYTTIPIILMDVINVENAQQDHLIR